MATKPEHDNGGWAFPQANGGGMSMFEWYSGQALASLGPTSASPDYIAKYCFDVAQAMIAEHKRRTA